MARINIEDSLWADNRFQNLMIKVGDRHTAKGMVLELWTVAQRYWLASRGQGIPKPAWASEGLPEILIQCGLAKDNGEFVYAAGSKEQFAWLNERSEAGKKGGPAAAKTRIENKGKLERRKTSEVVETQRDTSSYSSSFSNTNTEDSPSGKGDELALAPVSEGLVPKNSKFDQDTKAKMAAFMATYAKSYRAKYGGPPEKLREPAIVSKIGYWIKHISQERACQLAEVFLQVDYRPINDSCHDPWLFFRHLNRIGNALATGQSPDTIDWAKVFRS